MGSVIGLGLGVGLLLIWSAFFVPRAPRVGVSRTGRLTDLLNRAGLAGTSPRGVVAVCIAAALLVGLAVQLLSGTLPVALTFAVIASYLPIGVLSGRARNRQRELAEVWPEAVDNLASAVRAGMSLPEALIQLGQRGPEPLRVPFLAFALDYQVTGRFVESLDRLKDRLSDPVGDRVIEGLRIAREVGGGELGRLLRSLSGYLREDARTRSELESRQSWTINGEIAQSGGTHDELTDVHCAEPTRDPLEHDMQSMPVGKHRVHEGLGEVDPAAAGLEHPLHEFLHLGGIEDGGGQLVLAAAGDEDPRRVVDPDLLDGGVVEIPLKGPEP